MKLTTLRDVEIFIATLNVSDMLWHADDLVEDISNFAKLTNIKELQEQMNTAKQICEDNKFDI